MNKLSHFKVTPPPAFFAIALLLSGGSSLSAQSTIASSESVVCQLCPLIEVTCPSNALSTMPFNVAVKGLPPEKKITYTWEVHNATIARGQGTASIIVETQPNKVVTVTIEIGGLDRSCVASDSCSISWEPPQPRLLDHYGQASASEERQRLANFAAELDNNPTATGYIIVYGRDLKRGERAKKHLTEKHGIQPAQLVILKGGHNEAPLIELYLVPSGAEPPTPANRKSASP